MLGLRKSSAAGFFNKMAVSDSLRSSVAFNSRISYGISNNVSAFSPFDSQMNDVTKSPPRLSTSKLNDSKK
jgi:hypothetical protein